MRRIFIVPLLVMLAGCLMPSVRGMRAIVTTAPDYTVTIIRESDVTGLASIMPSTAPLYVEFGCDSCLVAEVKKGGATMRAELLSFGKSKNAVGAYFATDLPGSQPIGLGLAGRSNDSAVEFVKGRHVAFIKAGTGGAGEALEFAHHLERQISGDPIKPDVYESLPKTQLVDGTQLYFTGMRGFSLGFDSKLGEALNVGGSVEGAAAKYDVEGSEVTFLKVRYVGRGRTLAAVNSYLDSRGNRPIIRPGESLEYFTIINSDRTESYIAENGDWLYFLLDGPPNGKAQPFFTYVLRGGR
jgi:hypothetical protein